MYFSNILLIPWSLWNLFEKYSLESLKSLSLILPSSLILKNFYKDSSLKSVKSKSILKPNSSQKKVKNNLRKLSRTQANQITTKKISFQSQDSIIIQDSLINGQIKWFYEIYIFIIQEKNKTLPIYEFMRKI